MTIRELVMKHARSEQITCDTMREAASKIAYLERKKHSSVYTVMLKLAKEGLIYLDDEP